jgi:hypothetical protein
MSWHSLITSAQMAWVTPRKGMHALSLLALCTVGLSFSANAQKSTFITFDPPGSIGIVPNIINSGGSHGFIRIPKKTRRGRPARP